MHVSKHAKCLKIMKKVPINLRLQEPPHTYPSEGVSESGNCTCIALGMVRGFNARMASTAMCTC